LAACVVARERWPGERHRDRWKQVCIGVLVTVPAWIIAGVAVPRHIHHTPVGAVLIVAIDMIAVINLAVIGRTDDPGTGTAW
jgi:hypothetical protein